MLRQPACISSSCHLLPLILTEPFPGGMLNQHRMLVLARSPLAAAHACKPLLPPRQLHGTWQRSGRSPPHLMPCVPSRLSSNLETLGEQQGQLECSPLLGDGGPFGRGLPTLFLATIVQPAQARPLQNTLPGCQSSQCS